MTSRTWIGGGNNKASNPHDWSPTGVPQVGDTLSIDGASEQPPPPFTMNVRGNDLAGDTLSISRATPTINVSHHATVNVETIFFSGATFNLSQHSTLNIQQVAQAGLRVNVHGDDHLHFNLAAASVGTIDLSRHATWHGTFTVGSFNFPSLTVNGADHSVFDNDGTSIIGLSHTTINADVTGFGSFDVHAVLEFGKSVGRGQSIVINSAHAFDQGVVKIDQPHKFFGSITMSFIPPTGPSNGQTAPEIDLNGLANADSYLFQKSLLIIFSGEKPIDILRLNDATPNGFVVEQTPGSVHVWLSQIRLILLRDCRSTFENSPSASPRRSSCRGRERWQPPVFISTRSSRYAGV